jgi:hypothetical protein
MPGSTPNKNLRHVTKVGSASPISDADLLPSDAPDNFGADL